MITKLFNTRLLALTLLIAVAMSSCDEGEGPIPNPDPEPEDTRWITVAAARMGEKPGDGNGGTLIYSITSEDAKDPSVSIEPFENGFIVPSNRTARLQASEDGNTIFNISYAGDTGGNYTKYSVEGGQTFTQSGTQISIAPYVGSAPRWIKLFDGDKTGSAVFVSTEHQFDEENNYVRTEATMGVLTLDLVNSQIKEFKEHSIGLSAEEEAQGYYIQELICLH